MSIPSLHGSLTPHPRDRNVRAGTASIATAGALQLAVIAAALIPGSSIYAVLAAAGVALGATSAIAQLRHRTSSRIYQWMSALGGLVILTIGILVAVARIGASPILSTFGMVASYYVIPIAALACYIGGLGQLPMKWAGPTLLATAGAGATAWLSLGEVTVSTRILISIAAIMAIIGCVFPLIRALPKQTATTTARIMTIPAGLMILLMLHILGMALLPGQLPWLWIPPAVVAWTYMISGGLATMVGLVTSSRS